MSDGQSVSVITVGHSSHPPEKFGALLQKHNVEVLVDVRSSPTSRFAPWFDETPLRDFCKATSIAYVPMGHELGGRPTGMGMYDWEGRVNYFALAATSGFRNGIARVLEGAAKYRVVLMCAEEDPIDCHRRLLLGRVLAKEGADILHLRGDGSVQTENDVINEESARYPERVQINLWNVEEEWKSTQSVLPPIRRKLSSNP